MGKNLKIQKKLAGQILKCSPKKIRFNEDEIDEIKESITKADIRRLIIDGIIFKAKTKEQSKGRARKNKIQKSKGKRKGHGSRKGKKNARVGLKKQWINRVRLQRALLKRLKDKKLIDSKMYRELYLKSKGGVFRSLRHLKLYIEENKIIKKKK